MCSAGGFCVPLLPEDSGVRFFSKHGYEFSFLEQLPSLAWYSLHCASRFSFVTIDFRLVGEVFDVPRMVDVGRGLHEVVHDRVGDGQDFGFRHFKPVH